MPPSLLVACVFLVAACGHDTSRTVLVQADTTAGSGRSTDSAPAQGLPEVAFPDPESPAPRDSAGAVSPSSGGRTAERAPTASSDREAAGRAGPTGAPADGADPRQDPDEAREREGRPPPPVLLSSGRILLPPGTVFALELRTPIHTATTLIGDRFAARVTQDVAAGGRVVIAAGTLVEGRVSRVGNASGPGRVAFIELVVRKVWLPGGRHLRIAAKVLDVTGQEVVESSGDIRGSALVAGATGGAQLSEAARSARIAILEGILESLDGPAIITASTDREIIIPTGTPFTLELVEPLEIPAEAIAR